MDLLAVGAGPSVLVALREAKRAGLDAVAIDKGPICGALVQHPTYMRWFSTAEKLELSGFPLLISEKNPTRREYLKYCHAYVRHFGLRIVTYHDVTDIAREESFFSVTGRDMFGREYTWRARNVILGTGFYDSPRLLGVPGEDLPKVSHRYTETHYYAGHDVMIVGAGSSAAETALELWRDGARVTVAMRSDRFHTKYWIEPDIENRIKEGSIACHRRVAVQEIRPDDVVLRHESGREVAVANDFVLAMTGYEPDTALLRRLGAIVDPVSKRPELSEAFETTVPGLYVAGTLCAGVESNEIFIENSRDHGPRIVEHIAVRRNPARPVIDASPPPVPGPVAS